MLNSMPVDLPDMETQVDILRLIGDLKFSEYVSFGKRMQNKG